MRPTTDATFMTGRCITVGMRPEYASFDDIALDAGPLDAPEIIPAGSWFSPTFDDAMFPAYPAGAIRSA